MKDLTELKGKKYDGKRNHIKRFKKAVPNYTFNDLSPKCKGSALVLFDKWFDVRKDSRYFPKLAYNAQKEALSNACKYFKELNLSGGAIYSKDSMLGFIVGSRLNKNTFSAHFQYCDPNIQGLNQTVLWEACNKLFNEYEFINLEQDLGIPGLRQSKSSYHPHKMEKKFEIRLKP